MLHHSKCHYRELFPEWNPFKSSSSKLGVCFQIKLYVGQPGQACIQAMTAWLMWKNKWNTTVFTLFRFSLESPIKHYNALCALYWATQNMTKHDSSWVKRWTFKIRWNTFTKPFEIPNLNISHRMLIVETGASKTCMQLNKYVTTYKGNKQSMIFR